MQQQADRDTAPISDPDAWRQKKQWQTDHIRSNAKSGVITMWIFAIVWNGISTPILFVFQEEWNKGNYAILLGLLFPLVGLFLFYKAITLTREYWRFGIVEFVMDPWPGAIGGHVGGNIEVHRLRKFDSDYQISLECIYSYVSGSGDDRSRNERIKWAETGKARVESSGNGVRLSFRFTVPEDLPEADVKQSGDYYFWRLKIYAEVPGVNLERAYNIPVFNTGELSRHVRHDLSAQMQSGREQKVAESQAAIERGDFHLTDLARTMKFSETSHEMRLYFPMFRNKVLTLFAIIFGGGSSFATYEILNSFGADGLFGIITILFAIPFALVGLFGSLAAIYLPFNNLSVSLSRGKITVMRRLFFFTPFI